MWNWDYIGTKCRGITNHAGPALLLFAVAVPAWAPAKESEQAFSMRAAEVALLAEDWTQVAQLLESVKPDPKQTADPILRLLKAHIGLALNRNNEAVSLFLSVETPGDRKRWLDWADDFAARNPAVPIAHYFHGDALGRAEEWDAAVARFTTAIEKAPNQQHPLAMNGRGVAYAAKGAALASRDPGTADDQYRKARVDFVDAFQSSGGRLADAQANIGALALQRKDGASGALRAFDEALKPELSPHFALALHGRGCVKLVLSDLEGAKKDLEAAIKYAACDQTLALLRANEMRLQAYSRGIDGQQLLAAIKKGDVRGMHLDGTIGSLEIKGNSVTITNFQGGVRLNLSGFGAAWGGGSFGGNPFAIGPGGGGAVGGVDTAVTKVKWDGGRWPFVGYFTLAYGRQSDDLPMEEILEALAAQADG